MRTLKLTEETRNNLLEELLKRSPNQYGQYEAVVNEIIQAVREKRDEAVMEYTARRAKKSSKALKEGQCGKRFT